MTNSAEIERDPQELEKEVDRERARVADTIDALQSKFSSKGMFDEVAKMMSEHSGEITGGLSRAVRDNPLPLILTGIGLTWLIASSGEGAATSSRPASPDRSGDGRLMPRARVPETATGGSAAMSSAGSAGGSMGGSTGIGHAVGGARDTLHDTAGAVGNAARGATEAAGDALHGARDAVGDGLSAGMAQARAAADWGGGQGRELRRGLSSLAEEQPLVLGALALAIGAALGGALPRTRTEDALVGAEADRLKAAAKDTLAAEGHKVAAVAGAVAKEATRVAEEAGGKLAETADGLADQARQATDRLRDAAHEESEAQKNVVEGSSALTKPASPSPTSVTPAAPVSPVTGLGVAGDRPTEPGLDRDILDPGRR